MEKLNAEAGGLHIWLRTQANAPAQRPWFKDGGIDVGGALAGGRVGANQMKAEPHRWRWREIGPYLDRIAEIARNADVSPIEFADRQQFLLTNPGLGGRLQVAATIRCAVSIYLPGDVAPVHLHAPNASRTILSENGGYTTIEGERCEASRGDLILTPNGTWHDHGNDGATPVVWADILDFPLLEFLDCNWIDEDFPGERAGNARAQAPVHGNGYLGPALRRRRHRSRLCFAPARHWPRYKPGVSLSRQRDPRGAGGLARREGRSVRGHQLALRQPGDRRLGVPDPRLLGPTVAAG
jgi:mannose-6-phosphate isomerase-like protein (cupin superfamily)